MRPRFALAVPALAAFALAAAAGPAAVAQDKADVAKPEDYGVTEHDGRADDPLLYGEFVYNQRCSVCHSKTAGGATTYGPHLAGIVGREAAATGWTGHSDALEASELVWTEASLRELLRDPEAALPGVTKDITVRFRRSRSALIEYLKTL